MKYCPKCSKEITSIEFLSEPSCPHCKESLNIFPHYKALDKCRSLHAEEATILKTPQFAVDESILYSTTFPCLQCAKRILQSGIKAIVYVDPMPIRLPQVGYLNEFVFRFNRRFWPMVAFDSVLKIAARVASLTYREFYESAQTNANPPESDEPVLTG